MAGPAAVVVADVAEAVVTEIGTVMMAPSGLTWTIGTVRVVPGRLIRAIGTGV